MSPTIQIVDTERANTVIQEVLNTDAEQSSKKLEEIQAPAERQVANNFENKLSGSD